MTHGIVREARQGRWDVHQPGWHVEEVFVESTESAKSAEDAVWVPKSEAHFKGEVILSMKSVVCRL